MGLFPCSLASSIAKPREHRSSPSSPNRGGGGGNDRIEGPLGLRSTRQGGLEAAPSHRTLNILQHLHRPTTLLRSQTMSTRARDTLMVCICLCRWTSPTHWSKTLRRSSAPLRSSQCCSVGPLIWLDAGVVGELLCHNCVGLTVLSRAVDSLGVLQLWDQHETRKNKKSSSPDSPD